MMVVALATPSDGVVSDMLVAVVPLGRPKTPVELVVIVALPLEDPFSTSDPDVPVVPAMVRLPAAVPWTPRVGVAVQLDAELLVVSGIVPAALPLPKLTPLTALTVGVAVVTVVNCPAAL